jgi:hypothetical protein
MESGSGAKLLYRHLCAKEIKKEMLEKLERQIPVLVCKLENSSEFLQSDATSTCSPTIRS